MKYQVTLTIIDNNGSSATSDTYAYIGTQENDPPVARMTLAETAKTGEQILFDSAETYDPDGDDLEYLWEFGNGVSSAEESPSYSYSRPGTYVVNLTVSDGEFSDTDSAVITIKAKKSSSAPGFEIMLLIAAAAIILIINKKIKV